MQRYTTGDCNIQQYCRMANNLLTELEAKFPNTPTEHIDSWLVLQDCRRHDDVIRNFSHETDSISKVKTFLDNLEKIIGRELDEVTALTIRIQASLTAEEFSSIIRGSYDGELVTKIRNRPNFEHIGQLVRAAALTKKSANLFMAFQHPDSVGFNLRQSDDAVTLGADYMCCIDSLFGLNGDTDDSFALWCVWLPYQARLTRTEFYRLVDKHQTSTNSMLKLMNCPVPYKITKYSDRFKEQYFSILYSLLMDEKVVPKQMSPVMNNIASAVLGWYQMSEAEFTSQIVNGKPTQKLIDIFSCSGDLYD